MPRSDVLIGSLLYTKVFNIRCKTGPRYRFSILGIYLDLRQEHKAVSQDILITSFLCRGPYPALQVALPLPQS